MSDKGWGSNWPAEEEREEEEDEGGNNTDRSHV